MIAKWAVFILTLNKNSVNYSAYRDGDIGFQNNDFENSKYANLIASCFQNNKHTTKSVLEAMQVNGQEQQFSCELYSLLYCRTPIFPVYPLNQRISLQMCSYNNGLISAISER